MIGDNIPENIQRLRYIKIRAKSVLPKADPKKYEIALEIALDIAGANCEKLPVNNSWAAEQSLKVFGGVSDFFLKIFVSLFISNFVLESKTLQGNFVLHRCHPHVRCFFAPPSVRNLRSASLERSSSFPHVLVDSHSYSSISITFSRFQSPQIRINHLQSFSISKVPEGHHPRGTTLREALRGNSPLRGLCGGLSEGSAGSLRGLCGVSAELCGGPSDFPRVFGGSDPMLVTLGNRWINHFQSH